MALLPFAVQAQTVPAINQTAAMQPEIVLSNPPVKLNDKERKALELVDKWKKNPDKPRRGEDGSVKYLYGTTLPTLICTPRQVCSIRLQEGETVNQVNLGDQDRWKAAPSVIGDGRTVTEMVIVKVHEAGLTTNMIIKIGRAHV